MNNKIKAKLKLACKSGTKIRQSKFNSGSC